jgi:hypothetical protein
LEQDLSELRAIFRNKRTLLHRDAEVASVWVPAVEEAIFAGIPINVVLLFSLEQYLMIASKCFMGGQSTLCVELAFFGCLFGVLPS